MERTVEQCIAYEISEMHKNIDRLKHSLLGRDANDPALIGQRRVLIIQKEHLKFLKQLNESAHSYDEAISLCRDLIYDNERIHHDLSERETMQKHSLLWWHSLHQIQFGTDLLYRIKTWQYS